MPDRPPNSWGQTPAQAAAYRRREKVFVAILIPASIGLGVLVALLT